MKKDIHPKYFSNAKAKCVCGASFSVGATQEKIEVEICSKCHPFYTGKQTLIDTARRAEKFTARLRFAEAHKSVGKRRAAKTKISTKLQKNTKVQKKLK